MSVVVCADLSGNDPHRQIAVVRMVTSGNLFGEMISTLARKARGGGSIPALGKILLIFITLMTLQMFKTL